MQYSMKEARVFVYRGETRQDALDSALSALNGFLIGALFWCEYESTHIQYEKLADEKGFECILTLIYTRI